MNQKKKLLLLVDWFMPGYKAGGPIRSCVNLCIALHRQYDIYVLTTDTDHGETAPYPGIHSNEWLYNEQLGVHIYYAAAAGLTASQLKREIKNCKADFIYLNHLFSPLFVVYPIWLYLRNQIGGKMIVCPRGALYNSALSLKQYKKKPLLWLYRLMGLQKKVQFHATNEREKDAILQYFPGSNIVVANNLPDLNQLPFETVAKTTGMVKCIFIARIVPIKNLAYLLEVLQQVKVQVQVTVAGPAENATYWNECQQLIQQLPANIQVDYLGAQDNQLLPQLIRQHHLFVLPTTGENFGHSIFEALLAGRPVLISDQTPWLGLSLLKAGWDWPLHHQSAFTATINQVAAMDQPAFEEWAMGAWQYAQQVILNLKETEQYKLLFS